MSHRYFEAKEHTKEYQQYRPTTSGPLIDHVVQYLKEKFEGDLTLAIDMGCGSGQNTFAYARHFKNVIGCDVSPNQIEFAQAQNDTPNVTFQVSGAEKLNFPDGSVQLVVAMAAAHWFDLPKFFEEVNRILSPGGVVALYNYRVKGMRISWEKDPLKNEALNKIYSTFYLEKPLVDYWTSKMSVVLNDYKDIIIPLDDFTRDEGTFYIERRISLRHMMGEIRTWSAFPRMLEAEGEQVAQECLNRFQTKLIEVITEDLGETDKSPDDIYFVQKTPFVLLMGRKSLQ